MQDTWKIKCLVPDLPSAEEVLPYLKEIDQNRWYSNFGPLVCQFEKAMASKLQQESPALTNLPSIATFSSATTALELMLRAADLPKPARILTPALTFSATAASIKITGHTPVFCDVDPASWCLTPELAKQIADQHPIDAVLPVAIYGYPVDMNAWAAFQHETGIPVFVDAAAALGNQSLHPDVPTCFSLHATKPFGIGEGGLLVAGSELVERARNLSNFAFCDGTSREVGTNAKMAEVLAAYGLAQIKRFPAVQVRRQTVLDRYIHFLGARRFHPQTAHYVPGTLLFDAEGKADEVEQALNKAQIQTRKWYFPPLNEHKAFHTGDVIPGKDGAFLPVISELKTRLIGLPFHAFLTEEELRHIADVITRTLEN
ncbi:DegT/DnrJ/EryC1/StrS family aminotransferase [Kordiimonas sp.]|uniref:DegT/DnrJ/EryC1/StrS family aminotransferase n=1 Tax=Kordiimonas sp. TaxID=1970157 RepID=UPI003A909ED7